MKRTALILVMLLAAFGGVKAQNCEALVAPRFGYNADRMAACPSDKLEWYCCYARAAFYESDTLPASADLFSITEVQAINGGAYLPADYVVDLSTLSYYAYTFLYFQQRYPHGDKTLCFSTPSSAHPYLVLRSIDDMTELATQMVEQR